MLSDMLDLKLFLQVGNVKHEIYPKNLYLKTKVRLVLRHVYISTGSYFEGAHWLLTGKQINDRILEYGRD